MADDGKTFEIELMRQGIFADQHDRVTAVDTTLIRDLADSYDETASPAPLVLGHPSSNHPAYGWVKSLTERGGKLFAQVGQVPEVLREAVRDGYYRKCSASFFPRNHASNPKPERAYLRHVGLLGAKTPAIKGLADVAFSDADEDSGIIAFSDEPMAHSDAMAMLARIVEMLSLSMKPEQVAELVPQNVQDAIKGDGIISPAALCDSLNSADAALKARLSSLVQVESEAERGAISFAENLNEEFVGNMVREGRLAPCAREDIKRVLTALDTGGPVSFSDGGEGEIEKNPADVLRDTIRSGFPIISLGELTRGNSETLAFADEEVREEDAIRDHVEEARDKGRSITASQAAAELGFL